MTVLSLVILDKYVLYGFQLDLPFFLIIVESEFYALLCESRYFEFFDVFDQHVVWVDREELTHGQSLVGQLLPCDKAIYENQLNGLLWKEITNKKSNLQEMPPDCD